MELKGVLDFAAKNHATIHFPRFTGLSAGGPRIAYRMRRLSEKSLEEVFGRASHSFRGHARAAARRGDGSMAGVQGFLEDSFGGNACRMN